jgi:protein involved in polysaccharide export with SLBB domain
MGQLKYNIVILPGDLIFVPGPTIGEYYMGGNVQAPGAYSLAARKITLTQAVVAARGLNEVAWPSRTEIVRRLPGDKQVFVKVDLDKIFAGQEPDIYLKPDDRINVGTHVVAPFLAAFRNGFRLTYGFGFLYDRNYGDDDNNN